MSIKIALPKGRFMQDLNALFPTLCLKLSGYDSTSRSYRPSIAAKPELFIKVFQEKDIPIQVAVGNYDLGICGSDWIEELLARYSSASIIKIKSLGLAKGYICAAISIQGSSFKVNQSAISDQLPASSFQNLDPRLQIPESRTIRLASEYPNIAESFALKRHLGRFSVFPVWGSSEVYPPENADIVILPVYNEQDLEACGLKSFEKLLQVEAFFIANRQSWEGKNLSSFLESVQSLESGAQSLESRAWSQEPRINSFESKVKCLKSNLKTLDSRPQTPDSKLKTQDLLWLALPDGHQQKGTMALLEKAGLEVPGYRLPLLDRRLSISIDGVAVKVIRPQDMPAQVALGNFDLAITGQDWLTEHLMAFPSSPVKEIMKLGVGKVRIVAAGLTSPESRVQSRESRLQTSDFRLQTQDSRLNIRVASEYINIAESYARERHLSPYRVIPTWGASESFLPEDADLLIENIETGKTLREHGLVVLDVLFESQACLIGSTRPMQSENKARAEKIIECLKRAVEK